MLYWSKSGVDLVLVVVVVVVVVVPCFVDVLSLKQVAAGGVPV